jgi:hypothetical protein
MNADETQMNAENYSRAGPHEYHPLPFCVRLRAFHLRSSAFPML